MLLVATHTKTCQRTGEYILLVKRGCRQWEKEWLKHRLFPLRFRFNHMSLEMFLDKLIHLGFWGEVLIVKMWIYEVIRGGQSYSIPICGSLIWQNKHIDKLSPEASLRLSSSESERSEDELTVKRWFWNREKKKHKSSVRLSVDGEVLEINWTQTLRLGEDKQKRTRR